MQTTMTSTRETHSLESTTVSRQAFGLNTLIDPARILVSATSLSQPSGRLGRARVLANARYYDLLSEMSPLNQVTLACTVTHASQSL